MTEPIDLDALRASLTDDLIPGPWRVCTTSPNDQWAVGTTIGSDDGRRIADACVFGPPGMASYIAACDPTTIGTLVAELTIRRARDAQVGALVEAAKDARCWVREYMDQNDCPDDDPDLDVSACVVRLDAALFPFRRSDDKGDAT